MTSKVPSLQKSIEGPSPLLQQTWINSTIMQSPSLLALAQAELTAEQYSALLAMQNNNSPFNTVPDDDQAVTKDTKEEEETEGEDDSEEDEEDSEDEQDEQPPQDDACLESDTCEPTATGDEEEDKIEDDEGSSPLIPIGYGNDGEISDEELELEFAFGNDEDAVVVVFIDEDVIRDFLLEEGDSIPPELQPLDAQSDSYSTIGNTGLDVLGSGNVLPPIVLDLDGDGVELLDATETQFTIDIDGDNVADSLGWAGNDDGVLVYDADQNGQISNLDEFVFSRYDDTANSDLAGLASAFDSNQDGVLDSQDTKFADFHVWQDANGDGLVDDGEFQTLTQLGVASIGLTSDGNTHYNGNNLIFGNGTFNYGDDSSGAFADVGFGLEGGRGNTASTSSRIFTGSVLDNDDSNNNVIVTGVSNVTEGAIVLMNPDGTFTYVPPPGVTGITDTFNYTIQNDLGQTGEGTVSIDITGMVWYVDNTNAEAQQDVQPLNLDNGNTEQGTSLNPFSSFDIFNSLDRPDLAGDWFYIFKGTDPYEGGLALQENQVLLGQGADLTFNGVTLFVGDPQNAPTLQNTGSANDGSAVIISDNNTLNGFNIGATTGPAIGTIPQGDANISDITVTNSQGTGFAVNNNPPGNHVFSNINIFDAGGIGIDITNNLSGTLTFNNITVDGAIGAGIRLTNNEATIFMKDVTVNNVVESPEESLPGAGILVIDNNGSSFFENIQLTDNAAGFLAKNTGPIEVLGNNNLISSGFNSVQTEEFGIESAGFEVSGATGAPALGLHNITVGNGGITFKSISSFDANNAIHISDVAGPSAGIQITGDGTNAGSGGLIANSLGVGAVVEQTSVPVTFSFMDFLDNDYGNIFAKDNQSLTIDNSFFNASLYSDSVHIEGSETGPAISTFTFANNTLDNSKQMSYTGLLSIALIAPPEIGSFFQTIFIDNNDFLQGGDASTIKLQTSGDATVDTTITDNLIDQSSAQYPSSSPLVLIENGSSSMPLLISDNLLTPGFEFDGFHFEIIDFGDGSLVLNPLDSTFQFEEDIIADLNPLTISSDVLFSTSRAVAPVVLDLDGDGIELVSPEQSNVAHPSMLVNMGWVGSDDGLLVYDANLDGEYSGLEEMMLTLYHPDAKTDLDGLRLGFDSNADGVFDSLDTHFNDFYVWQDANQDGISNQGEMRTLDEVGVRELQLDYHFDPSLDNGNISFGSSLYVLDDGTELELGNIGLSVGQSATMSDLLGPQTHGNPDTNLGETSTVAPLPVNDPTLDHNLPPVDMDL